MLKYFIILILFGGGVFQVDAQQLPIYTQTSLNYLTVNPAVAGSKECLDLKMGYRAQWIGFEGAPRTAFVNAHGRIKTASSAFHGLGGVVETDKAGPFAYTSMTVTYAYNFRVNKRYRMAFGLGAGTLQYRLDASALRLPEVGVINDDALNTNSREFVFPLLHFGLWLYKNDRFYGLAIRHIRENPLKTVGLESKLNRHFIFSAGRTIDIDEKLYFKPTVDLRYVASSRLAADLNLMLDYNDMIAAGVGFRSEHGISALLKINAFQYVTIGYAYDLTVNRLKLGGQNTHEIILGIQACPRGGTKSTPCSAYD